MPSRGGSPNLVSDFARDADTCHLEPMPTLSWETVKKISERFASLNPYSFGGTILEIKEINYEGEDKSKPFRELFGDAVSAKRYCLFIGKHAKEIVDGKAHGIGYLMAPRGLRRNEAENGWTNEFWSAVLKGEGISCKNGAPEWLDRPAMMKIPVSSPAVLGRLNLPASGSQSNAASLHSDEAVPFQPPQSHGDGRRGDRKPVGQGCRDNRFAHKGLP